MAHGDRMTTLTAEEPVEDLSAFDLRAGGPGFVLVVNPGSLSMKLAIGQRRDGTLHFHEEELSHDDGGGTRRGRIARRMRLVLDFLSAKGAALSGLRAICVRGGFLHPTAGGLIRLNHLRDGAWQADARARDDLEHAELEHPSNYGIPVALGLIEQHGLEIPAFTLDPVTTDQMEPVARYAGKKGFVRRSIFHALNVFAASRVLAGHLGTPLESLNLLVCHLGGGTSVVAMRRGRAVDVNNALLGEPPFTPQRGVPQLGDALDYAVYLRERGARRDEILFGEFAKNAGLRSYTGTADLRELEARIHDGDTAGAEALRAMAYQIVKALGAMAAALAEPADALLITGGGARSQVLLDAIDACIGSGALDAVPVYVLPGALEQYAMVEQTLRFLDGEVAASAYEPQPTVESPRPVDGLADLLEAGKQLVREHPKTIALCLPNDESLEALRDAHEDGIIRGALLIGNARTIGAAAREADVDLDAYGFRTLEVAQGDGALDHAACAQAAVRAVRDGEADMLVKGVVSTGALLRAVLDKDHGITRGERLTMSCVTYLPRHDRLIVFADPGINTETDDFDIMAEEVRGALKLAGYLDMAPRVAFLSAVERPTPRIPSTLLAEQLAAYFTEEAGHDERLRGAAFQGPLSLDLALDPEVVADKACAGAVVGQANVLIFPNIESANAFYKFITQIEPSRLIATAIPGTTAPCVISSRGDSEANRMASLVLGAHLEELYQRRLKAKAGGQKG